MCSQWKSFLILCRCYSMYLCLPLHRPFLPMHYFFQTIMNHLNAIRLLHSYNGFPSEERCQAHSGYHITPEVSHQTQDTHSAKTLPRTFNFIHTQPPGACSHLLSFRSSLTLLHNRATVFSPHVTSPTRILKFFCLLATSDCHLLIPLHFCSSPKWLISHIGLQMDAWWITHHTASDLAECPLP